jgi:CHAT domain-containing protein
MAGQPFAVAGATPRLHKILGNAVALSPAAKIVADCGDADKQDYLRLTDYETGVEIARHPLPSGAHTLAFSGDGRHLLVMPGGKGSWSQLQVYAAPWTSPPIINSEKQLQTAFHGAWIDPRTIVIAGTIGYGQFCIGILTIADGRLRIVHDDVVPKGKSYGENSLDTGACSGSGHVAFGCGYGRTFLVYRLAPDRGSAILEGRFDGRYTGNSYEMAVDDKTGSVVCGYTKGLTLFDARGREVCAFDPPYTRPDPIICRSGILALRVYTGRGVAEVRVYRIGNKGLTPWCTYHAEGPARGCDVLVVGDRTLLAVEEDDHTRVLVLTDADVLQLDSQDAEERFAAVKALRSRRYLPARDALIRRIDDQSETADIRQAAAYAIPEVSDGQAIPLLIRVLGGSLSPELAHGLLAVLRRFDHAEVRSSAIGCARRPAVKERRGALRVLEILPEDTAIIGALAAALADSNKEVRLMAARSLSRRTPIMAAPALLGALDDDDAEVRLAVQQAVVDVLRSLGEWDSKDLILNLPIDMRSFARDVIATGRMTGFTEEAAPPASNLLGRLAHACVSVEMPELLNAIESLADPPDIGLVVAVVMGDAMRSAQRWPAAIAIYRGAAELAASNAAPTIEWRALLAAGECLAATHDDRSAWDSYQRAMKVIDRLWFALLDEDKLQQFFHEKARLYDRAALCALRLGYDALAMECNEKSKTRYLGDLIARRQRDPQRVLAPELQEFWRNTGIPHAVRVTTGGGSGSVGDEMEIVAVGRREDAGESEQPGSTALMPQCLARLQEYGIRGESHERLLLVRRVWSKVTAFEADAAEELREHASSLYEIIDELLQAMESKMSVPHPDLFVRFDQSLSRLLNMGEGEPSFAGVPLSGDEFPYWISQLVNPDTLDESTLLLQALQEALDTVLHRRAVIGVRVPASAAGAGGLVFATRQQRNPFPASRGTTTVIESSLQRFVATQWRYTMMLARGVTVGFRDVADSVAGRPDLAHVQFTVTDESTVVHLIRGRQPQPTTAGAGLRPAHQFETFVLPNVDDSTLRRLLVGGEGSWFAKYGARRKAIGRRAWMSAIDATLADLHGRVVAPVTDALEGSAVRRLQIVPHRGLHLTPFAGMYRKSGRAARRYVIDDYEIAYAPSATLHHICKERAAGKSLRHSLTAVANPTEDLPFSPFEVEGFAELFAKKERRILRGKQASAGELRALAANCFFHFAGHAYYAWSKPLDSALVLANEHRLTVGTLFDEGMPLAETMLVVLSACETNITDPHDPADEYIGLAAAFLFAGAPAVVCTLWAVDDVATMLLMGKLYHLLLTPSKSATEYLRPAAALRSAQLWLRDLTAQQVIGELGNERLQAIRASVAKGRAASDPLRLLGDIVGRSVKTDDRPFEHPYYWAAFVVVGDHASLAPPTAGLPSASSG